MRHLDRPEGPLDATRLIPRTAPWYDRLATLQRGYHYPWRPAIVPG